jgi:AcrR family transcriptional regulator
MEWVRPTHQSRSQETLERILDAAEAVIGEKGFEKATVSEIVRRAKSSVGAMYARFNDKDALLSCLYERFYAEAVATSDVAVDPTRWEGASIADILEEVIPFLVRVYQEKAPLVRALIVRGSTDSEFAKRGARLFQYISGRLSDLLMERRLEISHPNPALAMDLGLRMVFDTLDQNTLYSDIERTTYPLSADELAQELTRMFLGYLGVVPAEPQFHPER